MTSRIVWIGLLLIGCGGGGGGGGGGDQPDASTGSPDGSTTHDGPNHQQHDLRNGSLYHWDGSTWSRAMSGSSSRINGLTIAGTKLYSAGDYGTIMTGP